MTIKATIDRDAAIQERMGLLLASGEATADEVIEIAFYVQALFTDANRYRWLRKYEWDLIVLPAFVGHPAKEDIDERPGSPEQLDAALDEAISRVIEKAKDA